MGKDAKAVGCLLQAPPLLTAARQTLHPNPSSATAALPGHVSALPLSSNFLFLYCPTSEQVGLTGAEL